MLAHLSIDNIVKITQTEVVRGMPKVSKPVNKLCGSCQHGKQVRTNFKVKVYQSTSHPLELVHIDLCGLARTITIQGELYFMLFIDYFSKLTWVTFLKNNYKAF